MRSACKEEEFYRRHNGKAYCVLHFPQPNKKKQFLRTLRFKLGKRNFDFSGVWFPEVSFKLQNFDGPATFNGALFKGKVDFSQATFTANCSFDNSHFFHGARFNSTNFQSTTSFQNVRAEGKVSFGSATFSARVIFSKVKFNGDVSFTTTKFQFANFFDSSFIGVVSFAYASFLAHSSFVSVTFQSAAFFQEVFFNRGLYVQELEFQAHCVFDETTFDGSSIFIGTDFRKIASFKKTVFIGAVDFSECTFHESARFVLANFHARADFSKSTFEDEISFSERSSVPTFAISSSLNLQYANIKRPERVSFHSVTLAPNWFVNVDARKFLFKNVSWRNYGVQEMVDHIDLENADRRSPHKLLSIACRQIAVNAEENHRFEEASRFRYLAMDADRRDVWLGWSFWRLSWWYWLASGYGERPARAFLVLVFLWIFFAGTFLCAQNSSWWKPASIGPPEVPRILDVRDSAIYSLGVLTLQKPEPFPNNRSARSLVLLETVLGPLQAGLLALAVRRKFMR